MHSPSLTYNIFWPEDPVYRPAVVPGLRGYNLKLLDENFEFFGIQDGICYRMTAPAGFVFDGDSTPLLAQLFGVRIDAAKELAALPHDVGYYASVRQWAGKIRKQTLDIWYSQALGCNGYDHKANFLSYVAVKRHGKRPFHDLSAIDRHNEENGIVCDIEEGTYRFEFLPLAA